MRTTSSHDNIVPFQPYLDRSRACPRTVCQPAPAHCSDNVHHLVTPLTIALHNSRIQAALTACLQKPPEQGPPHAQQTEGESLPAPKPDRKPVPSAGRRWPSRGNFCIAMGRAAQILSIRPVWITITIYRVAPLDGGEPFDARYQEIAPWPARVAFAPELDWGQLTGGG